MSRDNTALYVGTGVLGITLLALMSRKDEPVATATEADEADESELRGSAGFAPDAGEALARHYHADAHHGTLYQCKRGDIVLGDGHKSLCWRALSSAARDCGIEEPEAFARETDRKIAYARLLCAGNEQHLTTELHSKAFRDDQGRGLAVKTNPVVWMPLLSLEALSKGIVMPDVWEDGSSTLFMPPEVRAALEMGATL